MRKKVPHILGATCASLLTLTTAPSFADCGQGTTGGITNIPTLGGSQFNVFSLSRSGALGGYSSIPDGSATHAFIYTNNVFTDLGTFGGTYGQVSSVNSSNQAAGYATTAGDATTRAFLFNGGPLIDLGDLGGGASLAQAMNDSTQITGNSSTTGGLDHAFLWSNGNMTDLGDLGGGYSTGTAINSSGTVIGDSFTADFFNFAFVYSNGVLKSLGDLGSGTYSSSRSINDSGMIVGESSDSNNNTHAFLYVNGVMSDLSTLGGTYSTAVAINRNGLVIGNSSTTAGDTHAFVSEGTTMTDLGTLGGNESEAESINGSGLIVGQATAADSNFHAVMWKNGVITDLNTLIPAGSGWFLQGAQYVNDAGRVVGFGTLSNQFQWFIFDPSSGSGSNGAPVAVATPNTQTVDCQTSAHLDGSASSDPEGNPLTYSWTEGNVVLGTNSTLTVSLGGGVHTITLTVTDPCDATGQTNVTVHVLDKIAPTIVSGPGPLVVSANGNCEGAVPNVVPLIVATDNCTAANALVITQDPPAGTMVPLGHHHIIVTVTDTAGNSTRGRTHFKVVDTTAPVISSIPGPITVSADANGQAVIPDVLSGVVASDSCTPAKCLVLNQHPEAGKSVGVGSYSIQVSVKDAAGNTSTATVAFNVIDTTAPVISCIPAPITVTARADGKGIVPNVLHSIVASDNSTPNHALVLNQSLTAGSEVGLGTYTIVVTVTDASGNSATANVILNVIDTTAPQITSLTASPDTISLASHTMVPVTLSVSATDNCDASPVSKIISITCGESAPASDMQITGALTASVAANRDGSAARVYTITVQCTDASGNSTTKSVKVTVSKH